jgi:hypothetical protein
VINVRSEEEVNKMIEEMTKRTKGKYITQGVSFNKTCPRQMDMLKKALMSSASFSGLAKEMLAMRFNGATSNIGFGAMGSGYQGGDFEIPEQKVKNIGNFI